VVPGRYWSVADMSQYTQQLFPQIRGWGWKVLANQEDKASGQVWFVFDVPSQTNVPLSFYSALKYAFTSLPSDVDVSTLSPQKLAAFEGGTTVVPNEDAIFFGGTWYSTTLATEKYATPNNVLDRAIRDGYVYLASAANFGQSASRMWVKVYVRRNLGGLLGAELRDWGSMGIWKVVPSGITPEQDIPAEQRGESPLIQILDQTLKITEELKQAASSGLSAMKPLLYTAGIAAFFVLAIKTVDYLSLREGRMRVREVTRR
jgi:hypothetical protein